MLKKSSKNGNRMVRRRRRGMSRKHKKFMSSALINRLGSNSNNGIPEQMYVKLKYTENVQTIGSPGFYAFRGNDLFDPNYTGTGHQPYLADQLCRLYSRYVVLGSKIIVRAATEDTSATGRLLVRPSITATSISDYNLSVERPDSKNCFFTKEQPCKISYYASTKHVQGVKDVQDTIYHGTSDTTGPISGPTGSGPWFWAIATDAADGATITCQLQVEIVYYVKLFKRLIQASS